MIEQQEKNGNTLKIMGSEEPRLHGDVSGRESQQPGWRSLRPARAPGPNSVQY
jgi:hypothetical protein